MTNSSTGTFASSPSVNNYTKVKMAEFVRAQIFGTTFEITSRYGQKQRHSRIGGVQRGLTATSDTRICSLWAWALSDLSGELSVLRHRWNPNSRYK